MSRTKQTISSSEYGVKTKVTLSVDNEIANIRKYLTTCEEAGLRLAGNYFLQKYRADVYTKVKKRTGKLKRNVKYQLKAKNKYIAVGFKQKAFYGKFFEKGKHRMPIAEPIIKSPEIQDIIQKALNNSFDRGQIEGNELPYESS